MRPYKPSNKVGLLGIPLLLATTLVSGLVIGGGAFLISYQSHFFIIILFPLVMGALGAFVLYKAVKIGKVRNMKVALFFAVLTGLAIIGVWRVADYEIGFRSNLAEVARLRYGVNVTQEEMELVFDQVVKTRTNQSGFLGYTLYLARQPQVIRLFSSEFYLPVNEFLMWMIWIVEWLIILGLCVLGAGFAVDDPFNEQSQRWYRYWTPFAYVSWDRQTQFVELMKLGDYQNAGRLITKTELHPPFVDVQIAVDGNEDSDSLLRIKSVELQGKNVKRHELLIGFLSPQELLTLKDNIADVTNS